MKQVLYMKVKYGVFAGDVYALFPEYHDGEIAFYDPVAKVDGTAKLEYFTDCMEVATPEESAAVRESLENMGYTLEEISVSDFMTALFPDKRTFYRLPCDQYGQPSGQIEKYRMTPGEYAAEKRYEEENHLAMWFDTYESALNRADD